MTDQKDDLSREELEDQDGERLPPREVMSTIDPDVALIGAPIHYPHPIPPPDPPESDV
jgi:hypothetical protein